MQFSQITPECALLASAEAPRLATPVWFVSSYNYGARDDYGSNFPPTCQQGIVRAVVENRRSVFDRS